MVATARASLTGLALFALCVGATPSPAPSPAASAQPSPAASPQPASPQSSAPPASAKPAASPSAARAKSKPGAAATAAPKASMETPYYKIQTEDINYKDNGDFTMPKHVAFSRPGSDGTADRAEGNSKRGTVSLFGNVVIHDNGNAPEAGSEDEYAKGGPSTLTCDQLDVDSKAKIYTAIGHVHFEQGDRKADADRGVLNRSTGMLRLQGSVKTIDSGSSLRADDMEYNLTTKRFEANGRPVTIKQPVPTPEPGSVASPSPKPKKRRLPF
jgi:lipopolysaccharide export system protein LptA